MAVQSKSHEELRINWPALLETTLFGAIGVMLLAKVLRGVLTYYIHPRYMPLVVVCALLLLVIGLLRSRAIWSAAPEPLGERGGWYLLLAVPLLLGVIVPAQPLDGTLLAVRGADLSVGQASQSGAWNLPQQGDTSQWSLLDWTMTLSLRPEDATGKPVDVVGFVFHDPKLGADSFYVARYVVTCCAADGSGVGLPVVWQGGAALPDNSWVRVRGTLGETTIAGQPNPAIIASAVEPTEQPDNPYLYP